MTTEEIRKALPKPQVLRLQQVCNGLRIGRVATGRLVVEPVKPHTQATELEKSGLLYLPESAKESVEPEDTTGIVIAVGPNVPYEPGEMVLYSKWTGIKVAIDNRNFKIFDVANIACTLEATEEGLSDVVQQVDAESGPDIPVVAGEAILGR